MVRRRRFALIDRPQRAIDLLDHIIAVGEMDQPAIVVVTSRGITGVVDLGYPDAGCFAVAVKGQPQR